MAEGACVACGAVHGFVHGSALYERGRQTKCARPIALCVSEGRCLCAHTVLCTCVRGSLRFSRIFDFFSKSDFKSGLHVYNIFIYHTYGPPPTQTHDMCRKWKIVNPKMQIRKSQIFLISTACRTRRRFARVRRDCVMQAQRSTRRREIHPEIRI